MTLDELILHAQLNPDRVFPMASCEECLAATLRGDVMTGHTALRSGEDVPRELSDFTRGASDRFSEAYWSDEWKDRLATDGEKLRRASARGRTTRTRR